MQTTEKPIAVLGATGAQGAPVAHALLDAGRPVRAIARTPERLHALEARGAEVVALDLADADALTRAFTGVAGVFSHLPFVPVLPVIEAQATALGRALVAARVPLAVHTSSGPVPTADTGVASFDTKAAADRILRASGAPIVFLVPTGYLANLSAPFSAPSVVAAGELRYPLPAGHRQPVGERRGPGRAGDRRARPPRPGRADVPHRRAAERPRARGGDRRGARRGPSATCRSTPRRSGRASCRSWARRSAARWPTTTTSSVGPRRRSAWTRTRTRSIASSGWSARPVADWARTQDWEAAAAVLAAP
jgi:uncharacterized protein YbjT (DUF2867 family)